MFTDRMIRRALEEDIGSGDITTLALVPKTVRGRGRIMAKQDCVLAGVGVAGGVFITVDPYAKLRQFKSDRDTVKKGEVILEIESSFQAILLAERVALNFLQRLTGIATLTRKFVEACQPHSTKILDTRKTMPMMRHLDKYATRMGGAVNHRMGLFDEFMVKDNHIAALGGDIFKATQMAVQASRGRVVVVEVSQIQQIPLVAKAGGRRVLLDNMGDEVLSEAIPLCKEMKLAVEVSGNMTLERIPKVAAMGADFISVGEITHSPRAADLSLNVERLA